MKPKKSLKILAAALLAASAYTVQAAEPFAEYERHVYVQGADSLPYRLLRPENPAPGQSYPLVVFIHGAGERGTDNEAQLTHGGQMWLNPVVREEYPAYVVAPQCPPEGYWAYPERPAPFEPEDMPVIDTPTPLIQSVHALVDSLAHLPGVDPSRVYLIGLSMGGMAVYDLAIRYPEMFAAAVPICGSVNPERLEAAKPVAFRIYHGDNDQVVTVRGSREAYRALRRLGADVEYHEFPGVTHGSWNPAFQDSGLLPWLFSKKK